VANVKYVREVDDENDGCIDVEKRYVLSSTFDRHGEKKQLICNNNKY
jgi:hypothetical protein